MEGLQAGPARVVLLGHVEQTETDETEQDHDSDQRSEARQASEEVAEHADAVEEVELTRDGVEGEGRRGPDHEHHQDDHPAQGEPTGVALGVQLHGISSSLGPANRGPVGPRDCGYCPVREQRTGQSTFD